MINELRKQLEESIERLGSLDIETIMLSRKLDKEINIEQRKRLNLLNKKRTLEKVQLT